MVDMHRTHGVVRYHYHTTAIIWRYQSRERESTLWWELIQDTIGLKEQTGIQSTEQMSRRERWINQYFRECCKQHDIRHTSQIPRMGSVCCCCVSKPIQGLRTLGVSNPLQRMGAQGVSSMNSQGSRAPGVSNLSHGWTHRASVNPIQGFGH